MKWLGAPLELTETSPASGLFLLSHAFGFVDKRGEEWIAPAGTITDGATIPPMFWPICGNPLQGSYRDPAVIHDAYYQSHARPKDKVDRMFYEAMLFAGTNPVKAWFMWQAVSWFGGWTWDEKGKL